MANKSENQNRKEYMINNGDQVLVEIVCKKNSIRIYIPMTLHDQSYQVNDNVRAHKGKAMIAFNIYTIILQKEKMIFHYRSV